MTIKSKSFVIGGCTLIIMGFMAGLSQKQGGGLNPGNTGGFVNLFIILLGCTLWYLGFKRYQDEKKTSLAA